MKKRKLLLTTAMIGLILTSCGGKKKSEPTPTPSGEPSQSGEPTPTPSQTKPAEEWLPSDANYPTEIQYLGEPGVQIHYQRKEPGYKEWGLWIWSEGKDGAEYEFNYQDDFGTIAYYPLSTFGNVHSLGFIVKKLFAYTGGGWTKDYNDDRFIDFDMLEKDEHDIYHVYLSSKKAAIYVDEAKTATMCAVNVCQFDTSKKITVKGNNNLKEVKLMVDGVIDSTAEITGTGKSRTIKLADSAQIDKSYTVNIEFETGAKVTKNVSIRKLYTTAFDKEYYYEGDLGAIYSKEQTEFKVWSPISSSIKLRIYNSGTPVAVDAEKGSDQIILEQEMVKGEKGVFSLTVEGDLEGKYYTYVVTNPYADAKEVVDPYAKSAGISGLRGMIVDFSKTNPEGWDEAKYRDIDRKHLVIYETHVADVTSSETWQGNENYRKKFKGMWQSGTTYEKNGVTVKTGFDHIKELGVNAIQIIPFFDQANDETNMTFNWGYNPLNYNVVEGGYSTDPYDGYVRIVELKELIMAYKEAGLSFIMDVVYNHVSGLTGSNFDVLMPYYYFRYDDGTGSPSSGSGCGNDTASERLMFRKFMRDSTEFWAREYKLDGFRFDLMGLHDLTTMNSIVMNLKSFNPNIVVFGEPWQMSTAVASGTKLADQTNTELYNGFGQFNDKGRDALLAGGLSPAYSKAWMNNEKNPVGADVLEEMIKGITHGVTSDPNKTINYATCHDNYTLHDRGIAAGIYDEEKLEGANSVANSLVILSQGTSFMLAGEEMLRTKIIYDDEGNPVVNEEASTAEKTVYEISENSYNSSHRTNELNYELKVDHQNLFETYQKLVALKKNVSDLGLNKTEIEASETFKVEVLRKGCVMHIQFSDGVKSYEAFVGQPSLYSYAKDSSEDFMIDLTGSEVYLDTLHQDTSKGSIKLNPYETVIIAK